jgi:hypothetical protein
MDMHRHSLSRGGNIAKKIHFIGLYTANGKNVRCYTVGVSFRVAETGAVARMGSGHELTRP